MRDPAHNRFKAPFWALLVVVDAVLAVLWAVRGTWGLAVVFVAGTVLSGMAWRMARSDRNPWWFRSFLDGR